MSHDVLFEHAQARPLTRADLKAFIADGVPAPALSWTPCGRLAMIMRDRVVFDRDRRLGSDRFEFARYLPADAAAVNAFTVPLLDEAGDVLDIMAWRPGGTVALWNGAVTMAGEEQVLAPRMEEALDAHETVLDWLRAGRQGIVVLDPARASDRLASGLLRTATAEHARHLRASLTRPAPRIVVAKPAAVSRAA